MGKRDIKEGSATVQQYFDFINERHMIWIRRFVEKKLKPWTDDKILQQYKFTNVFRELDRGTLALRKMIKNAPQNSTRLVIFNIMWYRMFNWYEHAEDPGFVFYVNELTEALEDKSFRGEQLFTNAHLTVGKAGESKLDTTLKSLREIWDNLNEILMECYTTRSLEKVFKYLLRFTCIGPFISYEIVSDFRWYTTILGRATDVFSWANIGPGCKRGLLWLGMDTELGSLHYLYLQAHQYLGPHLREHVPLQGDTVSYLKWPPFELREIEHCLCEFDKYMRVKSGIGRPRQYYPGEA